MESKQQEPAIMESPPAYSTTQASSNPGQPAVTVYPAQPVITTAVMLNGQGFAANPMQVTCSHCRAQIVTQTVASPGLITYLISGTLVLVGCWLGCCLIPFCVPECQDTEHRCPNCHNYLGTYRRI